MLATSDSSDDEDDRYEFWCERKSKAIGSSTSTVVPLQGVGYESDDDGMEIHTTVHAQPQVRIDPERAYASLTPGYRAFVVFAFVNQCDDEAPQHIMNSAAAIISKSPYSHVQILFPDDATTYTVDQNKRVCYRETDRGSYFAPFWDYMCIKTTATQYRHMRDYCESQVGAPYDTAGFYTTVFRWYLPCFTPLIRLVEHAISSASGAPETITTDGEELVAGMHVSHIVQNIDDDCEASKPYEYTKIPQTCSRLAMLALVNSGLVQPSAIKHNTSPAPAHVYELVANVGGRTMFYDCENDVYLWANPVDPRRRSSRNLWKTMPGGKISADDTTARRATARDGDSEEDE